MSTTYRTRHTTVEAFQVCHKNFYDLGRFIPGVITEANPTRLVKTKVDACGEPGPWLTFDLRLGQPVMHGQWLVKDEDGYVECLSPSEFDRRFKSVIVKDFFTEPEETAPQVVFVTTPPTKIGVSWHIEGLYDALTLWRFNADTGERISLGTVRPSEGLHSFARYSVLAEALVREGIPIPDFQPSGHTSRYTSVHNY